MHTCSVHAVDLPRPVGAELMTAWMVPSLRLETYHFTKCSKHSHEYSCSVYECYCEVSTAELANVFSYQDYFRIVEVDTCNSKHITHVRLGILSERKLTFFPLLRPSAHTPTNPQTYNHTHTHMYTHTHTHNPCNVTRQPAKRTWLACGRNILAALVRTVAGAITEAS